MMTEAERLSALHSETLGTRTLDTLHVAAVLALGLAELLTFDARQAALAEGGQPQGPDAMTRRGAAPLAPGDPRLRTSGNRLIDATGPG
jgi:hypothetical protein